MNLTDTSDILSSIAGIVIPVLLAIGVRILLSKLIVWWKRRARRKNATQESYSDKLARLTQNLTQASQEVDRILLDLSDTARERTEAVAKMEAELQRLEAAQKERQERIRALENVPLPAVDYLLKQMEPAERKSARRDYVLFAAGAIAGVVANILVGVLLPLLGVGR